ncbi:MAG: DivIVA domain-containing protein [Acidimicrobiales bacterium]
MDFTARDIRMKEFRRQLVGYSARDVDDFLMNLAVDFDRRDRIAEAHRTSQADLAKGEEIVADAQATALEIVERAKDTARTGLRLSRELADEILRDAQNRQQNAARFEAAAELRLADVERRLDGDADSIAGEAHNGGAHGEIVQLKQTAER